jgi:hypothetical protein
MVLGLAAACTFEDRRLHTDYDDNEPGRVTPPGGAGNGLGSGVGGSTSQNQGSGGTANSQGGSSNNLGTGGRMALGSGGTGSALGSGGSVATGCSVPGACTANGIPIGTGLSITPDNTGFVRGETNGLGVQGVVFTATDEASGGNSVLVSDFSRPGQLCFSGAIGQVLNDDYASHWGALVGLVLAQLPSATGTPPLPWSPDSPAGRVIGFRFTLSGPTIPAMGSLRFATVADDLVGPQYCTPVVADAGLPRTFPFSELRTECWLATGTTPMPANTAIEELHWGLVSNANGPVPFEFCIGGLSAVVQ